MFIVDLDTHIIHDASNSRYECTLNKLPKEKRKKVFTLDAVKRLLNDNSTKPPYNGCKYCMSEHHQFDMTSIYH